MKLITLIASLLVTSSAFALSPNSSQGICKIENHPNVQWVVLNSYRSMLWTLDGRGDDLANRLTYEQIVQKSVATTFSEFGEGTDSWKKDFITIHTNPEFQDELLALSVWGFRAITLVVDYTQGHSIDSPIPCQDQPGTYSDVVVSGVDRIRVISE